MYLIGLIDDIAVLESLQNRLRWLYFLRYFQFELVDEVLGDELALFLLLCTTCLHALCSSSCVMTHLPLCPIFKLG